MTGDRAAGQHLVRSLTDDHGSTADTAALAQCELDDDRTATTAAPATTH